MAAILARRIVAFSRPLACGSVSGRRKGLSAKVDSDPGFGFANELRIALADAQRWAGLLGPRGKHIAHLTLGYGDGLPEGRRPIPPFRFRVGVVDLVESKTGQSRHVRWHRWLLR